MIYLKGNVWWIFWINKWNNYYYSKEKKKCNEKDRGGGRKKNWEFLNKYLLQKIFPQNLQWCLDLIKKINGLSQFSH